MRIGFIGLGQMGREMAARLIGAGHELVVWNRSASPLERFEGRAQIAGTVQEAHSPSSHPFLLPVRPSPSRSVSSSDRSGVVVTKDVLPLTVRRYCRVIAHLPLRPVLPLVGSPWLSACARLPAGKKPNRGCRRLAWSLPLPVHPPDPPVPA